MASSEGLTLAAIIEYFKKSENVNETTKADAIKFFSNISLDDKPKTCDKCGKSVSNPKSCEYCIRNYLEKCSDWTSGDKDYDELIRGYQKKVVKPKAIIEWIPYDNLQDVKFDISGGHYRVLSAIWMEGRVTGWDADRQRLKRFGSHSVSIKYINTIPIRRYQEIETHLGLSARISPVVISYGLTKDPETESYMIVMENIEYNLRTYLQDCVNDLTWFQKYKIISEISESLECIHNNNLVHGDLHSGNIMYSKISDTWLIGDFGLCGSVDNPPSERSGIMSMYYVAPEVLKRNQEDKVTTSTDVFSFAMIMWEISTGNPPIYRSGRKRPVIMEETPKHFAELMETCWDNDPTKRPKIGDIKNNIKMILDHYKDDEKSEEFMFMKKVKFSTLEEEGDEGEESEVNPNPGSTKLRKSPPVEIIQPDQINNEKISEGIGLISTATIASNGIVKSVAIKSLQIDKSNRSKNLSFLNLLQERINDIREYVFDHPNIVEYLGVGIKDDDKLFLVMPFADGGNLRNYYKNNQLPFNEKIKIIKGITDGIKTLHENEIIHENINPENILFEKGIAKISNLPLLYNNKDLYFKNKEFYFDGTLYDHIGYVDPSTIIKKYKKDKPVDIYSLGTLLWEVASERVPYSTYLEDKTFQELIFDLDRGKREDDITDDNIPNEYVKLYKECWDGDSSKRPTIQKVFEKVTKF